MNAYGSWWADTGDPIPVCMFGCFIRTGPVGPTCSTLRHNASPGKPPICPKPFIAPFTVLNASGIMKIAQVAPLFESVPPKYYGGTERVVSYLTEALVDL